MFAIQFKYRVALAPLPTLFITATTVCKSVNRKQGISNIFNVLIPLLEKAQQEYGAIFMPIEPNRTTHDLNNAYSQENVVVCVSMHFKRHEDIRGFISNIDPRGC